jgi:hypothetical protein
MVRINFSIEGEKAYRVDNAELAVSSGASISDMIDVEARVLVESSSVTPVKHITGVVLRVQIRIRQNRKLALGRGESSVFLKILVKSTVLMCPAESVHSCLVKIKELLPVLNERQDDSLLLKRTIANNRIVNSYTAELVVVVISGCDEGVGDVRDIIACIGLASDVGCCTLEVECVDKVAPEANELETKFYFVGDVGFSLTVTYTDGLLDPDDVGSSYYVSVWRVTFGSGDLQVGPAV